MKRTAAPPMPETPTYVPAISTEVIQAQIDAAVLAERKACVKIARGRGANKIASLIRARSSDPGSGK